MTIYFVVIILIICFFTIGNAYHKAVEGLHRIYGEKTVDGKRIVLVAIGISEDEAALNSTRNKNGEPLVGEIYNLVNEDSKVDLLGMAPQNPLGMSLESAHEHLKHMKCSTKSDMEIICKSAARKVHLDYLKKVIEPIDNSINEGIWLQIGQDEKDRPAEIVLAFIVIFIISGDNKALNYLSSVNSQCKGMKCRCCNETNMQCVGGTNWEYRSQSLQKSVKELGEIQKQRFLKKMSKEKLKLSEEEIELEVFGKKNNLNPGENYLYSLGDKMIQLNSNHKGFHFMTPADELHTLLLGALMNCIVWIMSICYLLNIINPDIYSNIVNLLNSAFIDFPRRGQTGESYPTVDMPRGISSIFTENRSKTGNPKLSGSIPAARLPGICMTLIHAIGGDGEVLPRNLLMKDIKNKTLQDQLQEILNGLNIETIALNALQSCLNVVSFSRKESYTMNNAGVLTKFITIMRAHQLILWDTKNVLKQVSKNEPIIIKKLYNGYKNHALTHWEDNIIEYGPKTLWDTQRSEKYHKVVKGA